MVIYPEIAMTQPVIIHTKPCLAFFYFCQAEEFPKNLCRAKVWMYLYPSDRCNYWFSFDCPRDKLLYNGRDSFA